MECKVVIPSRASADKIVAFYNLHLDFKGIQRNVITSKKSYSIGAFRKFTGKSPIARRIFDHRSLILMFNSTTRS